MSATNRGSERIDADFYATPKEAFDPLLPYLPTDVSFWEPACGDRRLVNWLTESGRTADGTDLSQGQDFLTDTTPRQFVITNPPFSIAQPFADHALALAPEVMLLLRLNFLASKKRREWWRAHKPSAVFVLGERPSFAMFCECRGLVPVDLTTVLPDYSGPTHKPCKHKWVLPGEAERPKSCPKCAATKIKITTSDATDYAWIYWGTRFKGFEFL